MKDAPSIMPPVPLQLASTLPLTVSAVNCEPIPGELEPKLKQVPKTEVCGPELTTLRQLEALQLPVRITATNWPFVTVTGLARVIVKKAVAERPDNASLSATVKLNVLSVIAPSFPQHTKPVTDAVVVRMMMRVGNDAPLPVKNPTDTRTPAKGA